MHGYPERQHGVIGGLNGARWIPGEFWFIRRDGTPQGGIKPDIRQYHAVERLGLKHFLYFCRYSLVAAALTTEERFGSCQTQ